MLFRSQEVSELEDDEKKMFLDELGIAESGLDKLIKASYSLLHLISFLTTGEDETRAWTVTEGTKAPQAAGKIHTDFEKGFIRAETVSYDTLIGKCDGSMSIAKEKGLLRSKRKEYTVKDDVKTVLQFDDEIISASFLGSFFNFCISCIRTTVSNIFTHRTVK